MRYILLLSAVLLASNVAIETMDFNGTTVETASFYTLSTSSDTDKNNYGGREFTFVKQAMVFGNN